MDDSSDYMLKQKNKIYFDNISNPKRKVKKSKKNKKVLTSSSSGSFASQKVDFSNFSFVPDGYESIAYTLYFVFIPYIIGNIFLFLAISGGNFSSYRMLDTSAFFIVWAIGYEIVAIISLIWIMVLFLKHDGDD